MVKAIFKFGLTHQDNRSQRCAVNLLIAKQPELFEHFVA